MRKLPSKYSILVVMISAFFTTMVARLVISAVLPDIVASFDVTKAVVGLALTGMWAIYALLQFPAGIFGNKYGERKMILLAVGLTGIASILLALSPSFAFFSIFALFMGIGTGLYFTPAATFLANIFENTGQALGSHVMGSPLAGLFAPVAAAYTALYFGWRAALLIGALIALPVLAIGSLQLPETEPKTPDQTLRGHVNPTQIYGLVRPSILYTTVLAGICTFVWQSILSFFPTFLIEFKGISSVTASTMFGAIFVAVAVSAPISGNLSDKFGRDAVLALLMTIGAAGFATIVLVGSRLGAYIGILTIGIGMSWPGPVQSRYMDRFSEEEQGIGFGFVRTGYMLIGSMGSVVTGTIAESMGWISAYGLLGVLLFFLFALIAVNRILGLEL